MTPRHLTHIVAIASFCCACSGAQSRPGAATAPAMQQSDTEHPRRQQDNAGPVTQARVEVNNPQTMVIAISPEQADTVGVAGPADGPAPITGLPQQLAVSPCTPADWSDRALKPLLGPGPGAPQQAAAPVVMSEGRPMTDILGNPSQCEDSPNPGSPGAQRLARTLSNGIRVTLVDSSPAGKTGRNWAGNHCAYTVELADGSGRAVLLGSDVIPPFNSVYAVLRHGSAVYIGIQFNGYAREFPRGGCKVIAADLCEGQVKWASQNYTSNGDLALIGGDYLLTGYGFTAEKRILQVSNARSGKLLQTLTIPGNPESLQFLGRQLTVNTNHGPKSFAILR